MNRAQAEAEILRLRSQIAQLDVAVQKATKPLTYEEKSQISLARTRADSAFAHHGTRPPDPLPGEQPGQYRARLLATMQQFSPKLKNANIRPDYEPQIFEHLESQIYADAVSAAGGKAAAEGALIPVQTVENGLHFTRYAGRPSSWMAPFMLQPMIIRFNRELIAQGDVRS
jgi:hypothetical protein